MKSLNPKITDWRGRRVWIIGASSGIGAALARQLGKAGARLALSARREKALREIGAEEDLIVPVDVADAEALRICSFSFRCWVLCCATLKADCPPHSLMPWKKRKPHE